MRSELKFSQTINHEVCFLHSGRGVPQSSGKLCAVSEDCGVLLRAAQEVTGPLILRTSGRATPGGREPLRALPYGKFDLQIYQQILLFYSQGGLKQRTITYSKNYCHALNSNHSRTSFSTQIQVVSCSRRLCSRRDARAGNYTHAKRTIIRKKLQAKFKYISIEQNRK